MKKLISTILTMALMFTLIAMPTMAETEETSEATLERAYAKTGIQLLAFFNGDVDETLAEDISNYSISEYNNDNVVEVISAHYDAVSNGVSLITSGFEAGKAYRLTVSNVCVGRQWVFAGRDQINPTQPTFKDAKAIPGGKVIVSFYGYADAEVVEDVNNYMLKGNAGIELPIYSAEFSEETNTVEITSDPLQKGRAFTLFIDYISYKCCFAGQDEL